MQNKCDEFKKKITSWIDLINAKNAISLFDSSENTFQIARDIIDEMHKFAQANNLIHNTINPVVIDDALYSDFLERVRDPAISESEKRYLIENLKQLLKDQLQVLYIIICKPISTDLTDGLIVDKKIAINQAYRFAKANNIFTDGIPFRKLNGGKIISLPINIKKAYYKAYRDLYFMLKRK
jgi:hypothetical protein